MKEYIINKENEFPANLLEQMAAIEWKAGAYLAKRIKDKKLATSDRIVVLVDDSNHLLGFASLLKQDILVAPELSPFLSTVFVTSEHRGEHLSQVLVNSVITIAKEMGYNQLYTVTSHIGLYEKYGSVAKFSNFLDLV